MISHDALTSFVLNNVTDINILNAPNNVLAEHKFDAEFEKQINDPRIRCVPLNVRVFGCTQDDTPLPIVLKGLAFEPGCTPEAYFQAYQLHISLLGYQFVEPIIPITITDPGKVDIIRTNYLLGTEIVTPSDEVVSQIKEASSFILFAQERHDLKSLPDMWSYIIDNCKTMSVDERKLLQDFLDNLKEAANLGYAFDFPPFPISTDRLPQKNSDNVVVKNGKPIVIDSFTIWKFEPHETVNTELIIASCDVATKLLGQSITPNESYQQMQQAKNEIRIRMRM